MLFRILFALVLLATSFSNAYAQDIPPAGWTIRASQTSMYLTRPDLPDINVAVVSDVRPELTQEQKFDHVKTFFAERAGCPSLAKSETKKSFGGFYAVSDGAAVRCKLVSMGHWVKDGLQTALILNEAVKEDKLLGGVPTRKTFAENGPLSQAIMQDITEFFMTRYQIAQSRMPVDKVRAMMTADGLSKAYPQRNKPTRMVRMKPQNGYDGITDARLDTAPTFLLFAPKQGITNPTAMPCMNWDPTLFDAYETETSWHVTNNCERYVWRWAAGNEANGPEIMDPFDKAKKWISQDLVLRKSKDKLSVGEFYKPFEKGQRLNAQIGISRASMPDVINGKKPLSSLQPHDLILLPDGRFMAGAVRSATLEGGKTAEPVKGTYHLDGHAITLLLENGAVVYGFAGWLPYKGEASITHKSVINVNGWIYTAYCRDDGKRCD